jgi:CDP-diacylglycerol--glycerol-3-phosphate 3-phosphatidyltransferase
MSKFSYKLINGITIYRIAATPVLLFFIFTGRIEVFKWLLGISFFTDLIDGFLARKFKVTSTLGSKLDSIGDDLTVLTGIVGLWVFKRDFIHEQVVLVSIMLGLFSVQNILAFWRYKKMSSFHTYSAKVAAILQGTFLILMFFLKEPPYILFYLASAVTILDLIEEIILVIILPKWTINVKGLYWVLKSRERKVIPTSES